MILCEAEMGHAHGKTLKKLTTAN